MLAVSMAVFAIVVSVAALGVAWLTMSGFAAGEQVRASKIRILEDNQLPWVKELERLHAEVKKREPESLKIAVDALVGDLSAIRASNRKEFGALWGRLGGRTLKDAMHIDVADHAAPNGAAGSDFEAMIALQSAPPAKP